MRRVFSSYCVMVVLSVSACAPRVGVTPVHKLDSVVLEDRVEADRTALERYHRALVDLKKFMDDSPELFPVARVSADHVVSYGQRIRILNAWQRVMDYFIALESIRQYHNGFWRVSDKKGQKASFFVMYGAFLTQYRFALALIAHIENDPALDVVLNEKAPQLGLPEDSYSHFKLHYLNVAIASRFAWFELIRKDLGRSADAPLAVRVEGDAGHIWGMGKGQGIKLTLTNAWDMVKQGGKATWLPIQAGVSEWMGDTKVWRPGRSLITPDQIAAEALKLQPGDVLFQRREWYLSNVGLPGFWPHTVVYISTPEKRQSYFRDDAGTLTWVKSMGEPSGDLEELLKQRFPEHYTDSLQQRPDGHLPRCLEAVSEGVVFTTLEHSAACDSMAVLRPRLERREIARAIFVAFSYAGRPYDFDFNMATDDSLVCTELIFKAYEPTRDFRGLKFPLVKVAGRLITPANAMVKQYEEERNTPFQQLDFVSFLDGQEGKRLAVQRTEDAFCDSWKRPKWYVWTGRGRGAEPK